MEDKYYMLKSIYLGLISALSCCGLGMSIYFCYRMRDSVYEERFFNRIEAEETEEINERTRLSNYI